MIFAFLYFWKKHDKDKDDGNYEVKQPDPINEDQDRFVLGDGQDIDEKEMTKFRPSVAKHTTDIENRENILR